MPTIRKITSASRPTPFSNHVLVEKIDGGFHVTGVSNINQYVTHLSKPIVDRDIALKEAVAWAIEHTIPEVFVVDVVGANRR